MDKLLNQEDSIMSTKLFNVTTHESKHVQWCYTVRNNQTHEIVGEGAGFLTNIAAIYAAQAKVQVLVEQYHTHKKAVLSRTNYPRHNHVL
jgi:hypothetical protein